MSLHRLVRASVPLATFIVIASLTGTARAESLTERKLELLRGQAAATDAAPSRVVARSGVALAVAKHQRELAPAQALSPVSAAAGAGDLAAAKRRIRLG